MKKIFFLLFLFNFKNFYAQTVYFTDDQKKLYALDTQSSETLNLSFKHHTTTIELELLDRNAQQALFLSKTRSFDCYNQVSKAALQDFIDKTFEGSIKSSMKSYFLDQESFFPKQALLDFCENSIPDFVLQKDLVTFEQTIPESNATKEMHAYIDDILKDKDVTVVFSGKPIEQEPLNEVLKKLIRASLKEPEFITKRDDFIKSHLSPEEQHILYAHIQKAISDPKKTTKKNLFQFCLCFQSTIDVQDIENFIKKSVPSKLYQSKLQTWLASHLQKKHFSAAFKQLLNENQDFLPYDALTSFVDNSHLHYEQKYRLKAFIEQTLNDFYSIDDLAMIVQKSPFKSLHQKRLLRFAQENKDFFSLRAFHLFYQKTFHQWMSFTSESLKVPHVDVFFESPLLEKTFVINDHYLLRIKRKPFIHFYRFERVLKSPQGLIIEAFQDQNINHGPRYLLETRGATLLSFWQFQSTATCHQSLPLIVEEGGSFQELQPKNSSSKEVARIVPFRFDKDHAPKSVVFFEDMYFTLQGTSLFREDKTSPRLRTDSISSSHSDSSEHDTQSRRSSTEHEKPSSKLAHTRLIKPRKTSTPPIPILELPKKSEGSSSDNSALSSPANPLAEIYRAFKCVGSIQGNYQAQMGVFDDKLIVYTNNHLLIYTKGFTQTVTFNLLQGQALTAIALSPQKFYCALSTESGSTVYHMPAENLKGGALTLDTKDVLLKHKNPITSLAVLEEELFEN